VPQIFHRSTNTISRVTIFGGLILIAAVTLAWAGVIRSPYLTEEDVVRDQPVQFSHRHHVSALGIDCRYCHTSVERTDFAGIPSTQTCMNCHKQVWADSPMLEPVRASWANKQPIRWTRVNDVPDFVYFDHSIHVYKGIGCESCHGRVDQMPLTRKAESFHMEWCLDCHRSPERHLRPREEIFTMGWKPEIPQTELGRTLMARYNIDSPQKLMNCSICHR
jgi:hypothetical protein